MSGISNKISSISLQDTRLYLPLDCGKFMAKNLSTQADNLKLWFSVLMVEVKRQGMDGHKT